MLPFKTSWGTINEYIRKEEKGGLWGVEAMLSATEKCARGNFTSDLENKRRFVEVS
jgi:hypothetical protein